MSGGTVSRWLLGREFDRDAAILGLLLAVALFPLRFLASQIYIVTIPVVLGVGCVLYLLAARNQAGTVAHPQFVPGVGRLLGALVFAGVAGLVVVAVVTGGRTLPFYALAGVVGTLLFVEVLFTADETFSPPLLLAQVLAVAFVVRFAALYTSPGFVGIDIWTHHRLAAEILHSGTLSAIADDKHYAAPLYHLLVASTALLADVPLRTALYLSVGVAVPVSVLFVYGTTAFLVPRRWAVFATMAYVTGDYVVEWGIHLIPTSLGLAFFLGVVYALVRITRTHHRTRDFVLLAGFSVLVVLTHQVSSFIMLVLIGAGVLAQLLLRRDLFSASPLTADVFQTVGPVNLLGLGVFDFGLITFMWSLTPYKGDTFLETVLSYLRQTLASSAGFLNLAGGSKAAAAGAAGAGPSFLQQLATYVDTAGFLLLLGLTIVGCLYVVRRDRANHAVFTLLVATVLMLVFVLGLPLFGIRNFIPQRWFAFLYAPMAVLGAVGVRQLASGLDRRLVVLLFFLFAASYPLLMVTSSHGSIDNPVFGEQRARLSYTDSELAAVHTIGRMTGSPDSAHLRPDQVLFADHPYQTVFKRTGAYPSDVATIADGQPATERVVVYRTYDSHGASFFADARGNGRIRNIPPSRLCRPSQSVLYANGDVELCVTP